MMSTSSNHQTSIGSAGQQQQYVVSKATVTSIESISPTVKTLKLRVHDDEFTFKPGQWVDFFIANTDSLTGYSICSSTKQLGIDRTIDLAVKLSDHPVSTWVHDRCSVGVQVDIRCGGDFYYDRPQSRTSTAASADDVLFVAGGVGINPVISMIRQLADDVPVMVGRTRLLYSARNEAELIFKNQIVEICQRVPSMSSRFYVTRSSDHPSTGINVGRITRDDLSDAVADFAAGRRLAFVCGPETMMDDMEASLKDLGFTSSQIRYEKWW